MVERIAPADGVHVECGLRSGDSFEVEGPTLSIPTDRPFCAFAMAAVLPVLTLAQAELEPNHWLSRKPYICCPDPRHGVLLRLQAIGDAPSADGTLEGRQ